MNKLKVIIPLYHDRLPDLELKLLRNNLERLASHTIVLLMPEGLALDGMREQFSVDDYPIVRVSPEWLGRKNGVAGYNRMMLSAEFYELFCDSEYILICQTDAYIDRDELLDWCSRGYDYVGAPWPMKLKYNLPFIKQYVQLRRWLRRDMSVILRQDLFDKVGNGGLSLRRVSKCVEVCRGYSAVVEEFCTSEHNLYNEDVFWAIIPKDLRYPSIEEALGFSIDMKPKYCFKLANGVMPMGVHGLTYPKYFKFWHDKIALLRTPPM
ncbi:MAG: DUF5672 family protein [Rikenellaceae bacterium]